MHLAPIACDHPPLNTDILQQSHTSTTKKEPYKHRTPIYTQPSPPEITTSASGIRSFTPIAKYETPTSPTEHHHQENRATMANPPKIPLSTTSSTSTNPQHARDLQDQITLALLANGGIARIQTALRQRLDEAGWSENLREYVTQLFRSGECSTYFEAMEKVKSRVRLEGRDEDENAGVDGADLVVPVSAAEGGVEAVRRELEGVCEMRRKEG
jgi:hypothetical protein